MTKKTDKILLLIAAIFARTGLVRDLHYSLTFFVLPCFSSLNLFFTALTALIKPEKLLIV